MRKTLPGLDISFSVGHTVVKVDELLSAIVINFGSKVINAP